MREPAHDPKRVVRDGYDEIASRYEAWSDVGVRGKYLRVVEGLTTPGARVLDLGCGTGRHATARLATRFETVGVELSRVSAAIGKTRIPSARFVVGDMATVGFRPRAFSAVTAFFSLIHVPRRDHEAVVEGVRSWLPSGGVFAVTMNAGDAFEEDGELLGVPMYWSGWSRHDNLALLEGAGFHIEQATDETEIEDGIPVTHLWVLARAA